MYSMKWNVPFVISALVGGLTVLYLLERTRRKALKEKIPSNKSTSTTKSPSPHPCVKKLKNGPLPKAIIPEFENSAIRSWRLAYRRYRVGGEHGAEGQAEELLKQGDGDASSTLSVVDQGIDSASNSKVKFEEGSWDEIEHTQKLITEYRLGYRRHRMGSSTGAKGELGDLLSKMNKKSLRFLPAAQVASLRRSQKEAGLSRKRSVVSLQDPRFHVHFGAGKLGLGLMIPAVVDSKVKFAILQRPSKDFQVMLSNKGGMVSESSSTATEKKKKDKWTTISLKVNEEEVAEVGLVTCLEDIPAEWRKWLGLRRHDNSLPPPMSLEPRGLFVISEHDDVIDLLVRGASSFSTSLGPGIGKLPAMLTDQRLPPKSATPKGNRPALFAGENDHAAITQLGEQLEGRVDVVPCMVDRICIGRSITETHVGVDTEPYHGSIVVISPPLHVSSPPFTGNHVLVPRVSSEADYLCSRKLLMVNGSHTTLAFLTLATQIQGPPPHLVGDKLPSPECDMGLLKIATATSEQQSLIWAWAVARILVLLFEWDLEVIKSAHGLEEGPESNEQVVDLLVTYAQETLTRFDSTGDSVGRVLGGGVRNRYHGRLLPVKTFLDDMSAQLKLQQQQQLKQRIFSLQSSGNKKQAVPPTDMSSKSAVTASEEGGGVPLSRAKRTLASLVMDRCGLDLETLTQEVGTLVTLATPFTGQDAPHASSD